MFSWWERLTWLSKGIIFLILTLVLSTVLMLSGVYSGNKELITLFGIIRLTATFFILLGISVAGIAIGTLTGNGRSSVQFFGSLISCLILSQLMTTFLLSIVPLRNVPHFIPVFLVGALILTVLGFWHRFPRITISLVLLIMIGIIWAAFYPGKFQRLQTERGRDDETALVPKLVRFSLSDLENGRIVLFGPKGENRYWYEQSSDGVCRIYEVVGTNTLSPQTGEPLRPLGKAEAQWYHNSLRQAQEKERAAKAAVYWPSRNNPAADRSSAPAAQAPADRRRTALPPPEKRTDMTKRFLTTKALQNIPRSEEVAVLFTDTHYRMLAEPSQNFASQLVLSDLNASGSFFTSASAFDIMTQTFRGDRRLIEQLSLGDRIDFLVLGIVSTEDGERDQRGRRSVQARVILRLIPVADPSAGFQEFQLPARDQSAAEAINRALRLLAGPIVEKIKGHRT